MRAPTQIAREMRECLGPHAQLRHQLDQLIFVQVSAPCPPSLSLCGLRMSSCHHIIMPS